LSRADWIKLTIAAARFPLRSDPASRISRREGGLDRKFPVRRLAWPSVQPVGNFVQSLLRNQRAIRAFWQILAQQAIGVFIAAAPPWAVRIRKVNLHASMGRDFGVAGHFTALVVRHGFQQGWPR